MSRKGGEINVDGSIVPYGLRFTNVMPSLDNSSDVGLLFQAESRVLIWPEVEDYDKNGLRNFMNEVFVFHHLFRAGANRESSELQSPSDILPGTTFFLKIIPQAIKLLRQREKGQDYWVENGDKSDEGILAGIASTYINTTKPEISPTNLMQIIKATQKELGFTYEQRIFELLAQASFGLK